MPVVLIQHLVPLILDFVHVIFIILLHSCTKVLLELIHIHFFGFSLWIILPHDQLQLMVLNVHFHFVKSVFKVTSRDGFEVVLFLSEFSSKQRSEAFLSVLLHILVESVKDVVPNYLHALMGAEGLKEAVSIDHIFLATVYESIGKVVSLLVV